MIKPLSIPKDDFHIAGQLYTVPNSRFITVLCHGLLCTSESPLIVALRDQLLQLGRTSVFTFDFRGNGRSGGETAYGNYLEEAHDLNAVVRHLAEHERSHGPVELIVGHSKAASVVLMFAHLFLYSERLVMLSARFTMDQQPSSRFTLEQMHELETTGSFTWKSYLRTAADGVQYRQGYVIARSEYEKRLTFDMAQYCNDLKCTVLIIHGDQDEVIPVSDASRYHERITNSRLEILQGRNHFFTDGALDIFQTLIRTNQLCQ